MSKYILTLLLLTFSFTVPANASIHREYYTIDKTFCSSRALLGKASAEARQRGTSRSAWERQLSGLRNQMPKSSLLHASIPMDLIDTTQIYIDLYGDCM